MTPATLLALHRRTLRRECLDHVLILGELTSEYRSAALTSKFCRSWLTRGDLTG